jgi:putative ATPase
LQASEDVGNANPSALPQAVAAYQATQLIGMPECDVRVLPPLFVIVELTVARAVHPGASRRHARRIAKERADVQGV